MIKNTNSKNEILSNLDFHDFYQSEVENLSRPNNKGQAMGLCPFHDDSDPSFSVNIEKGLFKCFGCEAKGSVFDFYMKMNRVDFKTAISKLSEFAGIDLQKKKKKRINRPRRIEVIYDFRDENDQLLYQVLRYKPKSFSQRRPDPNRPGSWINNLDGVRLIPYRLSELLKADVVFVVEGEKSADLLHSLELTATCSSKGAGNWPDEFKKYFMDKKVIILPDNDIPGRNHAKIVANSLVETAEEIKVVELPGLPNKDDVFDWINNGHTKDDLIALVKKASKWEPDQTIKNPVPELSEGPEGVESRKWDYARRLFPSILFPWDVLPEEIAISLQQLARSVATSPASLPSVAIAIFASTLGATVYVSPKLSWKEPLIFWFIDIRPSGAGKTPAARILCLPLYVFQEAEDREYKKRRQEWEAKTGKNRGPEPKRAKGYFITDLTLEGLRYDISGHGGTVCVMDELSAFLNAQNQYKGKKGNDRESWLCLWEGKPARIVRVKESITINGARVSIFGGIQPSVWKREFGGNDGMYLEDGTIFRFLPTFEGDQSYPLTAEAWEECHRKKWDETLTLSVEWADEISGSESWQPKSICLDSEAQELFFNWRNQLYEKKKYLPDQIKGYIPKIVSYALRLSGVIYCMDCFVAGTYPSSILKKEWIQKGIKLATFYLGHIVDAMQSICVDDFVTQNDDLESARSLACILENLREEVDSGRLAIGYIYEKYHQGCKKKEIIKSARGMGALIRRFGLTIPKTRHDANGKKGVTCLLWDEKVDNFLKQHSGSSGNSEPLILQEIIGLNYESQHTGSSEDANYALKDLNIEKQTTVDEKHCHIKASEHPERSEHLNEQSEKWETGAI